MLFCFLSFLCTYPLFTFNVSLNFLNLLWWNTSDIISISCPWGHLSWSSLISSTLSWLLSSSHLDLHLPSSQAEPFTFLQSGIFCFLHAMPFPFLVYSIILTKAPPSITSWDSKCFATFSGYCWCPLWIVLIFKIPYLLLDTTTSTSGSPSQGFSLFIHRRGSRAMMDQLFHPLARMVKMHVLPVSCCFSGGLSPSCS